MDAQHGLAAVVGEAVLAVGRHDDELAWGERNVRFADSCGGLLTPTAFDFDSYSRLAELVPAIHVFDMLGL
jgi:hypothetical protein